MTDVELIKSKIDIVDFLGNYLTLKKAGRNYKAVCPFHNEKTPSFIVSPERQSWHCFGACATGGDVIAFLQKWESLEFVETLKILADKVGVELSNREESGNIKLKEKLYGINSLASEFFHYLLTNHSLGKRAMDYLKERGIKKEIIETFKLGYAPESWDSLLKFMNKKGFSNTDLSTAGLLIKTNTGRYYDRFRGRLIFTLRDHRGNTVGFSGRKLPGSDKEDKEAKYVNTSETPVYIKGNVLYGLEVTREAIKKENKGVVVEGEFDCLASYQSGTTYVVAIKGSALTEGQTMLLKRYTDNVVLALDSDFAGNEAARRGIEIAENAGFMLTVAQLPYGKDPADCIAKGPHLWKEAVKHAVPIYDFVINVAFSKYDKNDITGKKKIGQDIVPYLSKITNPIVQSHYIKELANNLSVSEESIYTSIQQYTQKGKLEEVMETTKTKSKREELLEEHLLSLIIQSENPKEAYNKITSRLGLTDFSVPTVKKIMEILGVFFKKHEKLDIKHLEKILAPEIAGTFDKAFLVDINDIVSSSKHFDKELADTIYEIKKISLRRKLNELATSIRQDEAEEKEDVYKDYREQQRQILRELNDLEKSSNRA